MKKKKATTIYSLDELKRMTLARLIREKERLARAHDREWLEKSISHLSPDEKRGARLMYRRTHLQEALATVVQQFAALKRALDQVNGEIAASQSPLRDRASEIVNQYGAALVKSRHSKSSRVKADKRLVNAATVCLGCGRSFFLSPYKGPRQRYCKDACRQRAYRQRRKAKPAASPSPGRS